MEYLVIEHYRISIFTQLVNEALAKGWKLQGGVSVSVTLGNVTIFYQAIIKE